MHLKVKSTYNTNQCHTDTEGGFIFDLACVVMDGSCSSVHFYGSEILSPDIMHPCLKYVFIAGNNNTMEQKKKRNRQLSKFHSN